MLFSTRGGRCGYSGHGGSGRRTPTKSIHGFIAASSLSIPFDTMTVSLSLCLPPSTDCCFCSTKWCKNRNSSGAGGRIHELHDNAGGTYLSLHLQVGLVAHQYHGELISVFYPQDLSLEFVDFLEAARQRRRGGVSIDPT